MKVLSITAGIAIAAAAIMFGFVYLSGSGGAVTSGASTSTPATPSIEIPGSGGTRVTPLGAREYQNKKYGFSVLYPDLLVVKEYDEGDGAITITFQNPGQATGFQIFITPYSKTEVDDKRFKEDVPSGVIKEPETTTLGGAPATAFLSSDMVLGETREVWSIKGGYLYEITTLKPLEALLNDILKTWQFL